VKGWGGGGGGGGGYRFLRKVSREDLQSEQYSQ